MNASPIKRLLGARVARLKVLYNESKSISHAATIGALRESYLRSFFRDLIPQEYFVTSGFLTHSHGDNITPQIDLIVADRMQMPRFTLDESTDMVPIEAVYCLCEVKSELKSLDIDQIAGQMTSTLNLKLNAYHHPHFGNALSKVEQNCPMFILAYDSRLSESKLEECFRRIPGLLAVCVVGKKIVYVDQGLSPPQLSSVENNNDDEEVLCLMRLLYDYLAMERGNRLSHVPRWAKYFE